MSGRGVHVVTVNDYLAKRDPQWMGPIFHGLGLSLGIIQHDSAFLFDPDYRPSDERMLHLRPVPRQRGVRRGRHVRHQQRAGLRLPARQHGHGARRARAARPLLRDRRRGRQHPHRRGAHAAHHQRPGGGVGRPVLHASPAWCPGSRPRPDGAEEGGDYFIDLKEHAVSPTEEGIDKIEQLLGVPDLYDVTADPRLARHFEQALRAHALYKRRPRLHRQGRRDRHRRRVHGPPDARPPLVGGPPPGDRGQGGPARPARVGDPGHDHLPELLPAVRQARRA